MCALIGSFWWCVCVLFSFLEKMLGKTREFPSAVDGSLEIASADIVADAFLKPGAVVRRNHRHGERHSAEDAYSEHASHLASERRMSRPGDSSGSDGHASQPDVIASSALPPLPPSLVAAAQEPPQQNVHVPAPLSPPPSTPAV
jgi:hypothetical protein